MIWITDIVKIRIYRCITIFHRHWRLFLRTIVDICWFSQHNSFRTQWLRSNSNFETAYWRILTTDIIIFPRIAFYVIIDSICSSSLSLRRRWPPTRTIYNFIHITPIVNRWCPQKILVCPVISKRLVRCWRVIDIEIFNISKAKRISCSHIIMAGRCGGCCYIGSVCCCVIFIFIRHSITTKNVHIWIGGGCACCRAWYPARYINFFVKSRQIGYVSTLVYLPSIPRHGIRSI